MLYYLTIGFVLGLSAGLSPGPLLTMVISESLQYGARSGIKVAIAPIITDLPLIIFSIFILAKLDNDNYFLGIISVVGACYLMYMGLKNIQAKSMNLMVQKEQSRSYIKGIFANIMSPHPYVFWLSIGAPIMIRGMKLNWLFPLLFIGSFYFLLVGIKILLAILIGRSRELLNGVIYMHVMRTLGIALWLFALILFREGIIQFGLYKT